jgi:hypothetical protein
MVKPLAAVALNSSTFTAINLGVDVSKKTVLLRCRSAIDVLISDTLAGTNYYTIPSGSALALNVGPTTGIFCYAKAASSTPSLEILIVE